MAKRFKDLNRVRKQRLISKAGFGKGAGKRAAKAYNKSLPKPAKIEQAPLLPGQTYGSNKAFRLPGAMKKTGTGVTAPPAAPTPAKIKQAPLLPGQTSSKSGAFNLRTPASGTGAALKVERDRSEPFGSVVDTATPLSKKEVNQMARQFFRSQGMVPGTAKHAQRFGLNAAPAAQGGATQPFEYDPGYQLSIDGGSFGDFKDMLTSRYMVEGRSGLKEMDASARARLDARDPLSGLQKLQYAIADFDPGQVSLAAQRAGITNVNSEKDFQELYNELTRPSTGMQTADTGRRGRRDPATIKYKKSVNQAIADGTLTVGELKRIAGKHDKSRAGVKKTAGRLFDKNFPGRELTIRTPGMGRKNIAAAEAAAEGGGPKVEGTDPESLIQMLLAGIAASNQAQALNQRLGSVTPQILANPFNMQGIGAFRSRADQFGTPSPFMGLSQIAS